MTNIFEKFSLNNQVAIVTGGAGLLGREFCETLAQAGARVVVADSDLHNAELIAGNLMKERFIAYPYKVDVTDVVSVQAMTSNVLRDYGRIDILVCSAAMDPKI